MDLRKRVKSDKSAKGTRFDVNELTLIPSLSEDRGGVERRKEVDLGLLEGSDDRPQSELLVVGTAESHGPLAREVEVRFIEPERPRAADQLGP